MNFIRLLLTFVIFYYLFRLVIRVVLPVFLSFWVKKSSKQKQRAAQDYINRQKREEGRVTINHIPKRENKKHPNSSAKGEYVDFEEIN